MNALRWTLIAFLVISWPSLSFGQTQLTDQQIAELIIRESREAYYATGHPCACPEDRAKADAEDVAHIAARVGRLPTAMLQTCQPQRSPGIALDRVATADASVILLMLHK